ncbi:MAG: response regulator [Bacteriovoracia bacterium]
MSKKRILLVEDDDVFRETLKNIIQSTDKYDVVTAQNGKAAQHLCSLDKFDAVISDIRMPEVNGIELTHFIKRTNPMPVILMTGFAELNETKEAHELGADGFLPKPFRKSDLEAVLDKLCFKDAPQTEESATLDEDFCKISIDEFVSGKQIQYDVFIRLAVNKFVKIAHKGEDLDLQRIKAYKEKNIYYLHLRKDDLKKYVQFNVNLSKVVKQSRLQKEKKISLLKHTGEVIVSSLFLKGIEKDTFDYGKTIIESTISLVSDDNDLFNLLNSLNSQSDELYAHSLGVSLYSTLIAKQMSWFSAPTLFKVALGGLLHDIGKKEIDISILKKSRKEMIAEEIKAYESHPVRGRDILVQTPSVHSDILQIVFQHHENCAGLGFPMAVKMKYIHPMARVITVANEFCNMVLKNPNYPEPILPKDAIERMDTAMSEQIDSVPFNALKTLFRVPVLSEEEKQKTKKRF